MVSHSQFPALTMTNTDIRGSLLIANWSYMKLNYQKGAQTGDDASYYHRSEEKRQTAKTSAAAPSMIR